MGKHTASATARDNPAERYQSAFQHAALGIALISAEGKVIEANPALEEMLGCAHADLEDLRLVDLTHPEDAEKDGDSEGGLFSEEAEQGGVEKRYLRRDGRIVWGCTTVSAVRDDEGQPLHFIVTVQDITARKQAETALTENERRNQAQLAALIDSIPGAVFIGDKEGVNRANRRALDLFGFDTLEELRKNPAQVMQQVNMRDVNTGQPIPAEKTIFNRALRGDAAESHVLVRHLKTGEERILHGSSAPVRIDGEITGAVIVTTDLTEQRRAEDTVRFLAEASLVLAASLDYQTTLTSVANLVVPKFADWCAIDVLEEDGELKRVVVTHADPQKQAWARDIEKRYPPRRDDRNSALRVIRTGQPELYAEIPEDLLTLSAQDEEHLKLIRSIGMRSAVIMPLTARGRTLGVISLIASEIERRYSEADLPAIEELARSCGVAVDNARLYQEAQHEITERRHAEEEIERLNRDLKHRVDELETLLEVSPVGLAVAYDPQGKTIIPNPAFAEMLGISSAANASKSRPDGAELPFKILKDGREIPTDELPMQRACLRGETIRGEEFEVVRKDGERLTLLEYASPLYDEAGGVRGSLGAFVDITEIKRVQGELKVLNETLEQRVRQRTEELQEANGLLRGQVVERQRTERVLERTNATLMQRNRELQDFAYVASHDLQEPLRKIHSFADLLRREYEDEVGEEGALYIDRIQNASSRMSVLIQDLLAFSRIATKGDPFQPVDLNQIAREVLSDLEISIGETGGKVEVDALPEIDADPLQMRQLFQNLIGNALKFHRPDAPPHIRVQGSVEEPKSRRGLSGPRLHLTFQDNGIGFDEKYLDRIFSPFQRLHNRTEYAGTGMGLAICRRIVERHHGIITAHSAPGEGATFDVELPVRQTVDSDEEYASSTISKA